MEKLVVPKLLNGIVYILFCEIHLIRPKGADQKKQFDKPVDIGKLSFYQKLMVVRLVSLPIT